MKPVDFPESNIKFSKEGCGDLKAYVDSTGIASCWELTDEDLEIINKTRTVWLVVMGSRMPPVNILTNFPFDIPVDFPDVIDDKG